MLIYSKANRAEFARHTNLMQDRVALKYRRSFSAEITATAKDIAAAYKLNRESDFGAIQKAHKRRVETILHTLVRDVAPKFAMVPIMGIPQRKDAGVDRTWLTDAVISAILEDVDSDSDGIAGSTLDQAKKIVADGVDNGETPSKIAQNIVDNVGGLMSRARAATIARTEVHSAANSSQYEMMKNLGIKMKREWIAVEDDRTREAHAEADGQEVDPEVDFDVDGEQLQYPGDPGGSAENTINCRCCVGYIPVEDLTGDSNED